MKETGDSYQGTGDRGQGAARLRRPLLPRLRRSRGYGGSLLRSGERWIWVAHLLSLLLVARVFAGEPVDILETWTAPGLAGWTYEGKGVSVANAGGYLNVTFRRQSSPSVASCIAHGTVPAGTLVTNISFRFLATEIAPSGLRVVLHASGSGNTWARNLSAPPVGEWAVVDLPVSDAAPLSIGPSGTAVQFFNDMLDIDWVGVYLRRSGRLNAQAFGLDDFSIQGETIDYVIDPPTDTDGDGAPDTWEVRYGFDLNNPADAAGDADGDGLSNYGEYVAGTHPRDDTSVLRIEITDDPLESAPAVRWDSFPQRVYSLWRSTNMALPFVQVEGGITSTLPVNLYTDTSATNRGPFFYRLGVRK